MKIEMTSLSGRQTHDFFVGAISPYPIALISTIGADGVYNAAPFSLVFPVAWKPPLICASIGAKGGQIKDTVKNIDYAKDFVVNIMSEDAIRQTIKASRNYPSDIDEIKEVGFKAVSAERVRSPLVAEAQVSMECKLYQKQEIGESENLRSIFYGEVLLVHVKDGIWDSGEIDPLALRAVGYLGGNKYCRTTGIMNLKR